MSDDGWEGLGSEDGGYADYLGTPAPQGAPAPTALPAPSAFDPTASQVVGLAEHLEGPHT